MSYVIPGAEDHEGYLKPTRSREGRIAGWVMTCDCRGGRGAWTGSAYLRAHSPDHEDLERGLIYADDEDHAEDICSREDVEDLVLPEWRVHAREGAALNRLTAAAETAARADRELGEAVAEARRLGATWQEIGSATGITRQAAHQRWARNT